MTSTFTLQLLHASDLEGTVSAIPNVANFAALVEYFENLATSVDGGTRTLAQNTILLSSGDNYLSGPFFNAAGDTTVDVDRNTPGVQTVQTVLRNVYNRLFGLPADVNGDGNPDSFTDLRAAPGRIDISIMNVIGFDASTLGNHEFDLGTAVVADIIAADIRGTTTTNLLGGTRWLGALFPYLASNLNFANDPNFNADAINTFVNGGPLFSTSRERFNTDYITQRSDLNKPTASALVEPDKLAPAVIIDTDGSSATTFDRIGVIGITTPLLPSISSPGATTVIGPTTNNVQLIAQFLQPIIDDVINGPDNNLGTADDINKIILVTHLQQFQIDLALAPLLRGVDIILAGGSDTILADANDPLRPGDTAAFPYPVQATGADGRPVLLVNTDGTYNYLGRLVVQFDANGVIIPASLNPVINGAYATTDAVTFSTIGLTDLNGDGVVDGKDLRLFDPNRDGISKAGLTGQLTDAVTAVVTDQDGTIVGDTSVFLEGRREKVRTEETNLGNLTADANLAYAKDVDKTVVLSLKNGGGIRDIIGAIQNDTSQNPPVTNFLPTQANPLANKQEGDISQLDIAGSLRFNNGLTLLTITQQQLYWLFEAAVAPVAPGQTPGSFPQVAGVRFSYDPSKPGLQELRTESAGSTRVFDANGVLTPEFQARLANGQGRIRNLALVDERGVVTEVIVKDGQFVGSATDTLRIVTLNFLAGAPPSFTGTVPNLVDTVYPFTRWTNANPAFVNRVDIPNSGAILGNKVTFTAQGTEQDALAEYLFANFNVAQGKPSFSTPDVAASFDQRIQNLAVAQDTVLATVANHELTAQFKSRISLTGGAEIVSFDPVSRRLFVVSGGDKLAVLNAANPSNLTVITTIDLAPYATTGGANYARGIGANSVAVKDGIVAVAVGPNLGDTPNAAQRTEANEQGKVLFFKTDGTFIREVLVGFLPDNLVFSPDGNKLVVANEGEPQGYQPGQADPEGSVSVITFAGGVGALTATSPLTNVNATFTAFNGQKAALEAQGAKFNGPNATLAQDAEPEYIAISADSTTAYVTLQENNAVAVVNLTTGTVTSILPLGFKDHSLPYHAIDASDQDGGFNPRSYPNLFGLYQPDTIAAYTVGGVTYLVTANEGDGREYDGFVEEVRGASVPGGLDARAFPNPAGILDNEALGRLSVVRTNYSDPDGDPQRERLFSFGGRSFSIWNAQTGQLVYDSGNAFDTIAEALGIRDNGRDDNKGTEPEALAIGQIGDQIYAFIGLERTTRAAAILVYNITDPAAPRYVRTIALPGDVSPEGLIFIRAEDSPSGKPLLVVANEVSNTVSVVELGVAGTTASLTGDAGNDLIYGGANNETIRGEAGNDSLVGGDGNDTIDGGVGDDILVGEGGNDSFLGGEGNDTIGGGTGKDTLLGGAGNDTLIGEGGDDSLDGDTGNDIIFSGTGNDTVVGGEGNDNIFAGEGNDTLAGGAGNDTLSGEGGNDTLVGEGGDDLLFAGAGNDVLVGGLGNDTLVGGPGSDRFGFATGAPFVLSTIGNDLVADFTADDVLALSRATFSAFTTSSGTVSEGGTPIAAADFAVIATGGATAAGNSSALIVYETSSGALYYNPDRATAGLGTGGQFATLFGAPALNANQILIVG